MSNTSSFQDALHRNRWLALALFILLVVGVGSVVGAVTAPGDWYAGLDKPPFNPPNWVFGPVWSILYVMIAIAGWRTWMEAPKSTAMALWVGQLVANWVWSPLFFSLQMLWPAFVVCLIMIGLTLGFIIVMRRRDAIASWLMVPYLFWLCFAGVLNASVAVLN